MERKKALRIASTDAERLMWSRLRAEQLGHKFRRRHEMLGYVVDFVCIERRVVVELDGSQHFERAQYDERRTAALEALGFRVLRYWNNDVLQRTDEVLAEVSSALSEGLPPHPNPLPRQRRGRGSRERPTAEAHLVSDNCEAAGLEKPLPDALSGGEGKVRGQRNEIRARLELRARLYALIRAFFAERGVLEVETAIMSSAANTDPNIESFSTRFGGHVDAGSRERWLRTSSEFAQKRLLAAGIGDCYELGRVFRDGEAGRRHNPEFTMLEWYRVGWDHLRLVDETVDLVRAALELVERRADVVRTTYRALFIDALGLDPFLADAPDFAAALDGVKIDARGLSRDDWLDLLLTHRIQPRFPHDRITVVHDYPASQCALAKVRSGDPPVAERFELYLGAHELANGYHELTDAAEQRRRFERDNARRRERGLAEMPLDMNLLAALGGGLPDCAGVALGIERLLMAMSGGNDIADVLAFAFSRA